MFLCESSNSAPRKKGQRRERHSITVSQEEKSLGLKPGLIGGGEKGGKRGSIATKKKGGNGGVEKGRSPALCSGAEGKEGFDHHRGSTFASRSRLNMPVGRFR